MTGLPAAAQRLAQAGCFVFPIKPRAKTPITEHGVHAATRDLEQITAWWQRWSAANIGVACGSTGLVVIDLDGPEGLAGWRALLAEHPGTPPTLTARTGGGGWHLYWLAPADRRLGNSASKIAPKIDTRGLGGYVLAPPSVHPTGRPYEWSADQPPAMATLPSWVADLLDPPTRVSMSCRPRSTPVVGNGYAAAALRSAIERISTATPGCRNSMLNAEAFSLARLLAAGSLDPRDAVAELLSAATAAGLPEREAVATITSALRARVGAVA